MRVLTAEYEVKMPHSLDEVLRILAEEPGVWRPIAGGTDVMVPPPPHVPEHTQYLDLTGLDALKGIAIDEAYMVFGALTTFTEVREKKEVHRHFPNLIKSARATAALAIQNRGTLGGNIMNGSPAADTPPSLLAYDAEVELRSVNGARWERLEDFWTGYKQFTRKADELLTRIRVRIPNGRGFHFYRKVGTRAAQSISKVSMACYARLDQGKVVEFRVGAGAVAPCCVRTRHAEAMILGRDVASLPVREAREALMLDISPIDDIRSTAKYRRTVAGNVFEQILEELARLGG
jgi:CO/xanthine dehydrogenase FAD-binding subunit